MKAIILAAGRGSRLWKHTRNNPKGLLEFAGKSLLEHQIQTLRGCDITDISIVTGYMSQKINFDKIKYYHNPNFMNTNMVQSLFCSKKELTDDCIITYSDILFEKSMIKKMVECKNEIGVVVDTDFEDYWRTRLGRDYIADMESLRIEGDRIVDIGRPNVEIDKVSGRYVGAIRFSKKGITKLITTYKNYLSKGKINFLNNREIQNWHMTDLLQDLISHGVKISPIEISRGWLEFDTENDYDIYSKWYNHNKLSKFIKI
tara:strand:- start:67 stop:843 length:777 start_codon:yes stop_codon:yes gene_type:complete